MGGSTWFNYKNENINGTVTLKKGVISGDTTIKYKAGWWFGTFFIFHNMWDNHSH